MALRTLKIRGPYQGPTGYDHHVREFTRAIVAAGVDVQLEGMLQWSARRLPRNLQDDWFDQLRRPVDASVSLQFCFPSQVQREMGMAVANYTMFEATQLPPAWLKARKAAITIVPEESSRSIWLASEYPEERLRVCPLGIDEQLFAGTGEPLDLIAEDGERLAGRGTRFLNIAEFVPRKNHQGLLRAWLMETTRADDAVLFLKLGIGPTDTTELLRPLMDEAERETGKRFAEAAPIHVITDTYADRDMPRLYASATHYLSMSFGEGWDLAMMEAAASSLHLIAPDHTAYRTYLTPETATLLPVREIPADVKGELRTLFRPEAMWWEPDIDSARAAIRDAIEGNDKPVASARDWILGNWTWRHAASRLIDILSELEQP